MDLLKLAAAVAVILALTCCVVVPGLPGPRTKAPVSTRPRRGRIPQRVRTRPRRPSTPRPPGRPSLPPLLTPRRLPPMRSRPPATRKSITEKGFRPGGFRRLRHGNVSSKRPPRLAASFLFGGFFPVIAAMPEIGAAPEFFEFNPPQAA